MLSYRTPFLLGCSMAVVLVIGFVPASLCADVVYVKAGPQPGTENGESWPTAWNTLQEGIAHANAYDIRWVAKGTYKAGSG